MQGTLDRNEFVNINKIIMKYLFLTILSCLALSCHKIEYHEVQYEEGKVIYKKYIHSYTTVNVSIDADGNPVLSTDTVPEEYILQFSCDHGEFQISSDHAKELFDKFSEGGEVIITYRQMDKVKYKDGVEVERHFYDWDFVTAEKFDRDGPTEE